MSEKKNMPIQTVSKGKRFEWKLCSFPHCPVPFDVSTRLKDVEVWATSVAFGLVPCFTGALFLPLSCLICAAVTWTACRYTHNTVTHFISQPCHRRSTHCQTFFQHSGIHSFPSSLLEELSADQKEPEKTICHYNNKGRIASHFLLHTFIIS